MLEKYNILSSFIPSIECYNFAVCVCVCKFFLSPVSSVLSSWQLLTLDYGVVCVDWEGE